MTPICFLNGEYLPLGAARISVLDRGFLFGDAVYEVIPAWRGRPFRLAQHLERLEASLAAIGIETPAAARNLPAVLTELIGRNGSGDLSVYLQISRGAAFPRDHLFPQAVLPTVFAMATPLRAMDGPVEVISLEDIRWDRCNVKATALLANVLLREQARAAGAWEALLLRAGELTEGAATNVFVVVHGRVVTPPLTRELLPGITRGALIEALRGTPIEVHERSVSVAELRAASEIWLTSSTREIVPVSRLDGVVVGEGAPGPLWREAVTLYAALRDRELEAWRAA